jgi:hypothetical protein
MITALPTCPYLVVVPATAIVVALASAGLRLGTTGIVGGALLGLVWSTVLGVSIERLLEREQWNRQMANGSVFLGIVASGVMLGGGLMYVLLMDAATAAPSAVLSAMMQPTIPFFILLNTPLELLIVPGAAFSNWRNDRRRPLIVIAAAAYYVMRVWTYLYYAPQRVEIASRPLLPGDIDWFHRTLTGDYRPVLVAVVHLAFTAAALVPALRPGEERSSQIGSTSAKAVLVDAEPLNPRLER